jgi:hypothetical protein
VKLPAHRLPLIEGEEAGQHPTRVEAAVTTILPPSACSAALFTILFTRRNPSASMMRILLASLFAVLFTEMVVHRRPSLILARILRLEVGRRVFHT